MPNRKLAVWITVVLIAIALIVVAVIWLRVSESQRELMQAQRRLNEHLKENRTNRIFVGFPFEQPREWRRVREWGEGAVRLDDGTETTATHIRSYIVAYPSGTVLDSFNVFE